MSSASNSSGFLLLLLFCSCFVAVVFCCCCCCFVCVFKRCIQFFGLGPRLGAVVVATKYPVQYWHIYSKLHLAWPPQETERNGNQPVGVLPVKKCLHTWRMETPNVRVILQYRNSGTDPASKANSAHTHKHSSVSAWTWKINTLQLKWDRRM